LQRPGAHVSPSSRTSEPAAAGGSRIRAARRVGLPYRTARRRSFLNLSAAPAPRSRSICSCACVQMGTAAVSNSIPFLVSLSTLLRRSAGCTSMVSKLRRERTLAAAVTVVRSMPRSSATLPTVAAGIPGSCGRFRLISIENCPFVSPVGFSARSKCRANVRAARCVCRHKQRSFTSSVVLYGTAGSAERVLRRDIYLIMQA
jgi:hypothetical protein